MLAVDAADCGVLELNVLEEELKDIHKEIAEFFVVIEIRLIL